MSARFRMSALVLGLLAWAQPGFAQVPAVINQEGVLVDNAGLPIAGPVNFSFKLYAAAAGGAAVWTEPFVNVPLVEGYYSLLLGSTVALTPAALLGAQYLGISVNGQAELTPRVRLGAVPFAMVAGSVKGGPVDATQVAIGGVTVIDPAGRWVGNNAGLVGPAGPAGPVGPVGPAGAAGAVGANGAPDTPAQVLAKLVQVDGAASGLDADRLDGIDSNGFVRTGVPIDAATLGGFAPGAYVRTPAEFLARLLAADGTGSGVDADRLDGLDSTDFPRTSVAIRDLLLGADGSGTGVDADRLDGLDSGQFMRTDANTSTTGSLTVAGTMAANGTLNAQNVRVAAGTTVGVGVANPTATVDVNGSIKANSFQLNTVNNSVCNAGAAGSIRWSGTRFEACNGSTWGAIGSSAPLGGTTFGCVPGPWDHVGGIPGRLACTANFTLPVESAVVAHINGHWGNSNSWCMAEIMFDNEPTYGAGSPSPYEQMDAIHSYEAHWKGVGMVRNKILPAGNHTARYTVTGGNGTCSLNGSSLHGLSIPTQGQGQNISCIPNRWDHTTDRYICTTNFNVAVRSLAFASFNGHWTVGPGWAMGEILFDGEAYHPAGSSPYVNKDGLHGYNTTWRGVSSSRFKILDPGAHTVRYSFTMSNQGGASLNGSSLRGFVVPAAADTTILDCVPANWSYSDNATICSQSFSVAQESMILTRAQGHWHAPASWCMLEILYDGEAQYPNPASPYNTKDGLHGYPNNTWQPMHHIRSKLLAPGQHTVAYAMSRGSNCMVNGSSMHSVVTPR